jgi:hypothetical protein
MKTLSTTNLDEIFVRNANWYLILLEDYWNDPFRDELNQNIGHFAETVCPKNWVIRGHLLQRDEFFSAIYHRYRLYLGEYTFTKFPRPAILVTNAAPPAENIPNEEADKIIRIVFPLAEHYVKAGSISDFLRNISDTLQREDALETLKSYNKKKFIDTWGWVFDFFEIKPTFLGIVSIDIKALIKHLS